MSEESPIWTFPTTLSALLSAGLTPIPTLSAKKPLANEPVEADEPLVELETDKVNLEVPSPVSGILKEINSKDGSIVEVGALLGSVSENGSASKKTEEIEKIQPTVKEDNVIKLETQKDEEEPKIFEEKTEIQAEEEKPLILTEEIKVEPKKTKPKNDQNLPLEQKYEILHHFQAKTFVHESRNLRLQNFLQTYIFLKLSIHHLD